MLQEKKVSKVEEAEKLEGSADNIQTSGSNAKTSTYVNEETDDELSSCF